MGNNIQVFRMKRLLKLHQILQKCTYYGLMYKSDQAQKPSNFDLLPQFEAKPASQKQDCTTEPLLEKSLH